MTSPSPRPSWAYSPSGILGGLCEAYTRAPHPAEAHRHPDPDRRAVVVSCLLGVAIVGLWAVVVAA